MPCLTPRDASTPAVNVDIVHPTYDRQGVMTTWGGVRISIPALKAETLLEPACASTWAPRRVSKQDADGVHVLWATDMGTEEALLFQRGDALFERIRSRIHESGPSWREQTDERPVPLAIPCGAQATFRVVPGSWGNEEEQRHWDERPWPDAVGCPQSESVSIGPPGFDGPPLPNAAIVVGGLRAGARACYRTGLLVDPQMSGSVTLDLKVSPSGEVSSADATCNTGLSESVVQCLLRKARNAQFTMLGHEGASVRVPLAMAPPTGRCGLP